MFLALVAITQVDAQCDEITYGEKSVEGLVWEGKCLYAIESNEGFQYAQAEAACSSINGELAPHMSSRDQIIAVSSYVSGENFIEYPRKAYKSYWLSSKYDYRTRQVIDGGNAMRIDMMLFNKYHPGCSGGRTRLNMAVLFRPPNYLMGTMWEDKRNEGMVTSWPNSINHALCVVQ